jgi:preprotein translocase subunit SecG
MKTIKTILEAWSHWLLMSDESEKFMNWTLAIAAALFFGNILIQVLIRS